MVSPRRVTAVTFYKNNGLAVSTALNVLRTVAADLGADNRRLSILTGLGVTKDETQGVLPSYLGYLQAMDLIEPAAAGSRFSLTSVGKVILENDPHGGNPATIALMGLLLAEPHRGAHMFDWAVRDLLWKLRPFKMDELRSSVSHLASAEGIDATGNVEVVATAFTNQDALGSVSPWVRTGHDEGAQLEPMIPTELSEGVQWACVYAFVRGWPTAFPDTFECQRRDLDRLLFPVMRGVVGLKGRTEEALLVLMEREGLIRSTAVTTERIYLAARPHHLGDLLSRPYRE